MKSSRIRYYSFLIFRQFKYGVYFANAMDVFTVLHKVWHVITVIYNIHKTKICMLINDELRRNVI